MRIMHDVILMHEFDPKVGMQKWRKTGGNVLYADNIIKEII